MQEAAFHVAAAGQLPEQEQVRCPRCESTNTKFCYYNNYNLLQPRHFCKNCRRYWTKGGALRNIPVGGGSRKSSSSSSSHKRPSSSAPPPKRAPPPPQPLPGGLTSLLASPPAQDPPSDPARLADGYWTGGWPYLAI